MRTEHTYPGVHAGSGQHTVSGFALESRIPGHATLWPVLPLLVPRRMALLPLYCAPTVLHAYCALLF
jgi:hypothetical protein